MQKTLEEIIEEWIDNYSSIEDLIAVIKRSGYVHINDVEIDLDLVKSHLYENSIDSDNGTLQFSPSRFAEDVEELNELPNIIKIKGE